MIDGLYQVTTSHFCAGFVVKDGKIVMCAPILRRRIRYWVKRAVYVGGPHHIVPHLPVW